MPCIVRRQGFWNQWQLKLRESLARLVDYFMRRVACDASGAFRVSWHKIIFCWLTTNNPPDIGVRQLGYYSLFYLTKVYERRHLFMSRLQLDKLISCAVTVDVAARSSAWRTGLLWKGLVHNSHISRRFWKRSSCFFSLSIYFHLAVCIFSTTRLKSISSTLFSRAGACSQKDTASYYIQNFFSFFILHVCIKLFLYGLVKINNSDLILWAWCSSGWCYHHLVANLVSGSTIFGFRHSLSWFAGEVASVAEVAAVRTINDFMQINSITRHWLVFTRASVCSLCNLALREMRAMWFSAHLTAELSAVNA